MVSGPATRHLSTHWDDPLLGVISGVGVVCCCGNVGYNLSLSIEEAGPEQLRGELSQLLRDLSAGLIC